MPATILKVSTSLAFFDALDKTVGVKLKIFLAPGNINIFSESSSKEFSEREILFFFYRNSFVLKRDFA